MSRSASLEADALAYALTCPTNHDMSILGRQGENLYWAWAGGSNAGSEQSSMANAVESWYSEVSRYDYTFGTSTTGEAIGHFTQIAWRGTTEVGCAVKLDCTGMFPNNMPNSVVVCRYAPPGNYQGMYTQQVMPTIASGACPGQIATTVAPPPPAAGFSFPPPAPGTATFFAPPAPPGSGYRRVVTVTVEISGSIQEFDADAYRQSMAALFNVNPNDIELTVVSASVLVTARISTSNEADAIGIVEILRDTSMGALSQQLNVTVVSVQAPTTVVTNELVTHAPSPPLPPFPPDELNAPPGSSQPELVTLNEGLTLQGGNGTGIITETSGTVVAILVGFICILALAAILLLGKVLMRQRGIQGRLVMRKGVPATKAPSSEDPYDTLLDEMSPSRPSFSRMNELNSCASMTRNQPHGSFASGGSSNRAGAPAPASESARDIVTVSDTGVFAQSKQTIDRM